MDTARYAHSIQVELSFGLVSGVITSLGLVVGLAAGTESRLAVIGGIVTIVIVATGLLGRWVSATFA